MFYLMVPLKAGRRAGRRAGIGRDVGFQITSGFFAFLKLDGNQKCPLKFFILCGYID